MERALSVTSPMIPSAPVADDAAAERAAEIERRRAAREAAVAERVRIQAEHAASVAGRDTQEIPESVSPWSRPAPASSDTVMSPASGGSTFESLFGRTLPIWGGGLTLAIAGILVVKWSIDIGLLSPAVRVILGLLFGTGLVAGAEAARRFDISDDRIPQALSGAGVAAMYGSVIAASVLYGIIGDAVAMAGLVAVTVTGGALSLRFGAPSAALALAGGLAAPAIVGGEPNLPILSIYLAMVSAGAAWLGRIRGSSWLSGAAMAGVSLWSVGMIMSAPGGLDAAFAGLLILCAGFAIPVISRAEPSSVIRSAGVVAAVVQCGALVASGGHGAVQWTMLGAATALALLLSERTGMRSLPSVVLGVFVVTAVSWVSAAPVGLLVVLLVFGVMHAVHALFSLSVPERRDVIDAARLAVIPLISCAVFQVRFPGMEDAAAATLWGVGALLTFGAAAAVRGVLYTEVSRPAEAVGAAMATAAVALCLPREIVPAALVAAGAAFTLTRGWRVSTLAFSAFAAAASLPVVGEWLVGTVGRTLLASPVLIGDLPSAGDIAWTMPAAVAACLLAGWRVPALRTATAAAGCALGVVMLHTGWRSLTGISTEELFIARGMLDRTVWEAVLAAAAVLAWRVDRRLSAGLALASLAHFGIFTLGTFNPMWSAQAVGDLPLLNLVTVSHGVAIGLLWACGRVDLDDNWARARRICQMVLITMFAVGILRQIFGGDIPALVPVSGLEDVLRSVTAIAVAIGLLIHGLRTGVVDWRAGSLVLMLCAVTKVFLFDADGLDGLARVASFAALGFSLIGVGWLYSRLLPEGRTSVA